MENNNSKMTYSELVTNITNKEVESIKISSTGSTASVKLKNSKSEKEVSIPSLDSFMSYTEEYLKEGASAIKDTHSRTHYLIHEDRLQVEANKKLLERLEYLEAENEYLKKSYALIQKRERQKKNKS